MHILFFQKLIRRKKAAKAKTSWDEPMRTKVRKSLDIQFMSSEEEHESDSEMFFVVRPLSWISDDYKQLMAELDRKSDSMTTQKGKIQKVKRTVSATASGRQPPSEVLPEQEWILK